MRFIISLLLTGLTILIAVHFTPAANVDNFGWAILAGLIIGLVNGTIGLILRIFTLPLNILTLGLISFLITVLMISFTDFLLGSKFEVGGFWHIVLFAIIIAIVDTIVGALFKSSK